jgi:hypothetical protein
MLQPRDAVGRKKVFVVVGSASGGVDAGLRVEKNTGFFFAGIAEPDQFHRMDFFYTAAKRYLK